MKIAQSYIWLCNSVPSCSWQEAPAIQLGCLNQELWLCLHLAPWQIISQVEFGRLWVVSNFFQVQIFKLMTSFTSEWSRGGDVGCVCRAWLLSLPSLHHKRLRNQRRTRKAHLRCRHNSCWLQNGLNYVLRSQCYLYINSPQYLCQCVGPQHLQRRED